MAEYIERSDAAVFFENSKQTMWHKDDIAATISSKKNIPSADVVEVVHCSECKHGRNCVDKDEIVACLLDSECDNDLGIDYGFITYHSNNHYCSYGERSVLNV